MILQSLFLFLWVIITCIQLLWGKTAKCWWLTTHFYTEPNWKLFTFIIQIANTISNQCISLCLYKIGNITKAIICLKLKVICHDNREITYKVKTDSLSETQLVVRTKWFFAAIWEKLMSKLKTFLCNNNAKARFQTLNIPIL